MSWCSSPDIPAGPKLLLVNLLLRADDGDECVMPPLSELAEVIGTTEKTVQRYLSILSEIGVIEETVRVRIRI